LNIEYQVPIMDKKKVSPPHETEPEAVKEEQKEEAGNVNTAEGTSGGQVPTREGDALPAPKAPPIKKDAKVKRDPSSAAVPREPEVTGTAPAATKDQKTKMRQSAVRPGAVAGPGSGATSTATEPREPDAVATKKTSLKAPPPDGTDAKIKMNAKAERARSHAAEAATATAVQPETEPGQIAVAPPDGTDAQIKMNAKAERARSHAAEAATAKKLRPVAVAVAPGLIATSSAETAAFPPPTMHTASPFVLVSKATIANSSSMVRPGAVAVAGIGNQSSETDTAALPPSEMHTASPDFLPSQASGVTSSETSIANRSGRGAAAPVSEILSMKDETETLSLDEESDMGVGIVPGAAAGLFTEESRGIVGPPGVAEGTIPFGGDNGDAVPMAMLVTEDDVHEIDREALFNEARLTAEADVRQHMMTKVVDAEIIDDSLLDQQRKRRRRFQYLLLCLVIIVAGVVGGVVGSQSSEAPLAPSMAPSMSAFPSAAPTNTPDNDFCDEPKDVTLDETVKVESFQNTTIETRFTCSSGEQIEQRGRWYAYSGNGLGLTVEMQSAPEDETAVEVFTGTCDEDGLKCTNTTAAAAKVNFLTSENTTYLIHVFSTLNATSEPIDDYSLKVSDNSGCGNAYPVDDTQTLYSGSTDSASVEGFAPECGLATKSTSRGVWYKIVGDGMNIEASTCGGASFDTQISVFTGVCGNLTCVIGNNDSCGIQSSVLWLSRVSCRVSAVRDLHIFLICLCLLVACFRLIRRT
jgi:hypothetical protein